MSILSDSLFAAVRNAYPGLELPLSSRFAPLYSLGVGELSSTAAVELARITKRPADEIARVLIDILGRSIVAEWRQDNGYLIASQLPARCLLAELPDSFSFKNEAHIRPPYIAVLGEATDPVYARIRLLGRALLQALLSVVYSGPTFVVIPEVSLEVVQVVSKSDVIDLFRHATKVALDSADRLSPDFSEFLDVFSSDGSPLSRVIWASHRCLDRLSSSNRGRLFELRRSGVTEVIAPNDGWLLSRERSLSNLLSVAAIARVVERLETLGQDGWGRFLFHCSSSTLSGDFDPAVALFDESASPLWNMRALIERYERFLGGIVGLKMPLSRDSLSEDIDAIARVEVKEVRQLILQSLFMPLYTRRAVFQSEVQIWCDAFESLARRGHLFMNAPATRLALIDVADSRSASEQSDRVCKIASSLGFGLSSILGVI
jgi:hypothetical protein